MKHVNVVCAIIKNDHGEVLVCKRGPGRALEGKWEFPGGKIEEHETYNETIVREIKEELKTIVKPIVYLGVSHHEYTNLENPFSITMHGVLCSLVKGDFILTEHTEKKWVSVKDLPTVDFADADKPFIPLIQSL